jgi:UDP-N-acetylglucosamine 2-epimerase (non-hydrolysing)
MLIDIIAGARPNFMKIAPIIHAIQKKKNNTLKYRLIHTGQHYDNNMSNDFFEQLEIPLPHINLGVGSDSHANQTAKIMIKYEELLLKEPSNLCWLLEMLTQHGLCHCCTKIMYICCTCRGWNSIRRLDDARRN